MAAPVLVCNSAVLVRVLCACHAGRKSRQLSRCSSRIRRSGSSLALWLFASSLDGYYGVYLRQSLSLETNRCSYLQGKIICPFAAGSRCPLLVFVASFFAFPVFSTLAAVHKHSIQFESITSALSVSSTNSPLFDSEKPPPLLNEHQGFEILLLDLVDFACFT